MYDDPNRYDHRGDRPRKGRRSGIGVAATMGLRPVRRAGRRSALTGAVFAVTTYTSLVQGPAGAVAARAASSSPSSPIV